MAETVQQPVRREPDTSPWLVDGQPLEDRRLREQISEALADAAAEVDAVTPPEASDLAAFDAAELALDRAIDHITEAIARAGSVARVRLLIEHLTALNGLQRELGDASLAHRSRALARVHDSLARLRDAPSVDQMMEAIPTEVTTLGFPRVILSRVRDSHWVPEVVVVDGDPEWAAEILRAGREDLQRLDHMILETEMVRRRMAMIVRDVQNDPRAHRPIADTSFARSYVAAPLMPEGRVVGFIHADCYTLQRDVDEFDRDLLWAFAEGAGYAFDRTLAQERLRHLRQHVRELTHSIGEAVDGVIDAEVEIARLDRETAAATRSATTSLVTADSRIDSLLTRREVEIAQLMAAGHTNGEIARRLVITEGTVKTHVSHILRKVHATNRAHAVSALMKLAQRGAPS